MCEEHAGVAVVTSEGVWRVGAVGCPDRGVWLAGVIRRTGNVVKQDDVIPNHSTTHTPVDRPAGNAGSAVEDTRDQVVLVESPYSVTHFTFLMDVVKDVDVVPLHETKRDVVQPWEWTLDADEVTVRNEDAGVLGLVHRVVGQRDEVTGVRTCDCVLHDAGDDILSPVEDRLGPHPGWEVSRTVLNVGHDQVVQVRFRHGVTQVRVVHARAIAIGTRTEDHQRTVVLHQHCHVVVRCGVTARFVTTSHRRW
ncbi:hypothetical protein D3C86_1408440 [compost metagenome]